MKKICNLLMIVDGMCSINNNSMVGSFWGLLFVIGFQISLGFPEFLENFVL